MACRSQVPHLLPPLLLLLLRVETKRSVFFLCRFIIIFFCPALAHLTSVKRFVASHILSRWRRSQRHSLTHSTSSLRVRPHDKIKKKEKTSECSQLRVCSRRRQTRQLRKQQGEAAVPCTRRSSLHLKTNSRRILRIVSYNTYYRNTGAANVQQPWERWVVHGFTKS